MKKILLIDDNEELGRLLCAAFAKDFRVLCAKDLAGGRDLFAKKKPDLTLLDIELPDGNGVELLGELLRASPKALIVMLSANDQLEMAREAMRRGACEYVCKPFSMDHLRELIARRLSARP
ncbi:MAG: response regulator [Elusimicrobiota bacterium]